MILTDIFKVMKKTIILFLFFSFLISTGFSEDKRESLINTNSLQFTEAIPKVTQREQALPFLDLKSNIETGKLLLDLPSELPVQYVLSNQSTLIVTAILNNTYKENLSDLTPVINPEDLVTSQNSEEYQLKRILESDFQEQNWKKAYELFTNFLSVEHSEKIKIKAHFYRAQVLFFQNKYRESFMEFTLAGNSLGLETKPWIDTILNYLHELDF